MPPSLSTVQISIYDTIFNPKAPTGPFMGRSSEVRGMDAVTYALGNHPNANFDLGSPKDMVNDFLSKITQVIHGQARCRDPEKHHVPLDSIDAIIWTCDPPPLPSPHTLLSQMTPGSQPRTPRPHRPLLLLPKSTRLVVGPGVKEPFISGYSDVEEFLVPAREFAGREVEELVLFRFTLELGGLKPSTTSATAVRLRALPSVITSIRLTPVLFPRNANDWKEKELQEKGCWLFLTDFKDGLELAGAAQV
ncbi:hypothetical protein BDW72DRAFT_192969 [Aspergillus terricola var. indicus]